MHTKKILIAPLDWGLGHATRCIVLIDYLQKKTECDITIAASGKIKSLLQNEFPQLSFLDLPGYQVSYSKHKRFLPLKILQQIPKILKIIQYENKWLCNVLKEYRFDAVISDNRFGLYSADTTTVFITHQLEIQTNIHWLNRLLQRYNYRFINRFNMCWVPDIKGTLNVAGKLSNPAKMPAIPVKFIGPLSRFEKAAEQKATYKWMAIISGPEPQRSIFENKIFDVARKSGESFLIVRGLPGNTTENPEIPGCKIFNHLSTTEMLQAINASEFIISRCGYTTVMEILSLQKKSVLIPTPGQTEQEYLAQHLFSQNWCYSFTQEDDFMVQLQKANSFAFSLPEINTQQYKTVLDEFVEKL